MRARRRAARGGAGRDGISRSPLGSEGSCQIGGNLSTNAGGLAALRYGVARELVLGLEVVLPDGRILDGLKSLRKDNTGYDLRHLFMGAEGTLGVITAATSSSFPPPRTVSTAFVAVAGVAAAVELLARLREATGDAVMTFELLPRFGIELAARHVAGVRDPLGQAHDWYVLCEIASAREDPALRDLLEAALGAAMSDGCVLDAVLAESGPQREALWRLRESIPEAQRREGASIKHDVSVPVAQLPDFVDACDRGRAGSRSRWSTCSFTATSGDGNLHFNVTQPEGTAARGFPGAHGGHRRGGLHAGPRVSRQHQRRARHRTAQASRARRATRARSISS